MKKATYCLLIVLVIFSQKAISQVAFPDTLVFGSDSNFPPYEFIDKDGKPAGFNIDLIRAIGKEMGFHVKIKLGEWAVIRKELEEVGSVQISDMFYTKERDLVVDYSIPIEVTYDEIFIRKGQKGISTIADLSGKNVAVLTSSTVEEYLYLKYPEIKYILTKDEPQALKLLSDGKCDAAIVSHSGTFEKLKEFNITNLITIGHPILPREHCFVVKAGNYHLLNAINSGLIHLKDNREFDALHDKWFALQPKFKFTRYIIIPGLAFVLIILFILLWNGTLRYAVKDKTKELEFTNSRLRLISTVKAARIDKLSTAEQTIELLKHVQETFDVDACIVRILLKDEMKLSGSIGVPPVYLAESIPYSPLIINETLNAKEFGTKANTNDLSLKAYSFENELAGFGFKSYAGTNMIAEGRITGMLGIYSEKEGHEFTKIDLDHLQIVADQIGISIENNRLFEQNEKQKEILVRQIISNKKAKEEIEKLNAELEQRVVERTAQLQLLNKELETFTYSVSHDLKAPLRGIDGYSKLLLDLYGKELNEEAKTFLTTIRNSTLQMNQLIEDLLDYSRLERSQKRYEIIKIKNLVTSISSLYKNELDKGKYSLKIEVPDIELTADEKGLTISLRNLLENAIKFTKGKDNPTIEIGLEVNDSSWIIHIKDNGIGFDMKYNQRIFEIFQRLQRAEDYAGTGIGLAMVSKAIQRMNGKVWAESIPGVGSTFYLEIPAT